MKVVFDIEADGLSPKHIWVIVCKNIDTGEITIFREPTKHETIKNAFLTYAASVTLWIGHNIISFDIPALVSLLGLPSFPVDSSNCIDTLVISRLLDYSREDGHSLASYGEEFGLPKIDYNDWSKYSKEMEEYCVRDVEINHRIFSKFTGGRVDRIGNISNEAWRSSIDCEQQFEAITSDMHNNGFGFNSNKCSKLLDKVTGELDKVDQELAVFPPRVTLIREVHPRVTKYGTLNRGDFRFVKDGDLSDYNGGPFSRIAFEPFNPDSHKQIVDVLTKAGWSPIEKTKTHLDTERAARRRDRDQTIDWNKRLSHLSVYGWKINETNLATLPSTAPKSAKTLARRILLESRRRTITEWLDLVGEDNRIHGRFQSIGAWTHRMAHQEPNTANIPNEYDTQGKVKLYGAEMRSLWQAPPGRLLVGVDAEGIQLRIFAHYIDDQEFTNEVSTGDPHTLNQQVLGNVCKSRAAAKRFIYALLLGAGMHKLSEILETTEQRTQEALDRLLLRFSGFEFLRKTIIPKDAKRGFFYGLDGRAVKILGETEGSRRHLAMSGYLQNGEVVVMKHATLLWYDRLKQKGIDFKLVDMVHDEWQTECTNDTAIALEIAQCQAEALRETGERLGVKCPLAGSYINKELLKKGHPFPYTVSNNWKETH